MANFGVSIGCIQKILAGEQLPTFTLQIVSIKKVSQPGNSGRATDRYRVVISDTINNYSSVMLATSFNNLVETGQLASCAIVRVDKFQLSAPENVDRPVIVLLSVKVVHTADEVGNEILGNPQSVQVGAKAAPAPAQIAKPNIPPPPTAAPGSNVNSKSNESSWQSKPVSTAQPSRGSNASFSGTPGGANSSLGPIQSRKIVPIAGLSPYQNRWTIKARVTLKTPMRTWSNSKGEGRLFSFNLLDESGEIRATAFTQEADRFFNLVEVNKVYYISRGTLKVANKQFSGSIQHDYEMQMTQESEIVPCDDDSSLPSVSFDFLRISDIEQKNVNDLVDVIGVARDIGLVKQITSKQGREMKKRDIVIADQSGVQIGLTLWGVEAENFESIDSSSQPIIAAKNARVNEFSGSRSLTTGANCQIVVNPDIPEAHQLRGWYDREGMSMEFSAMKSADGGAGMGGGMSTAWRLLGDMRKDNLGSGDRPDYITAVGIISNIKKENCVYKACPQEGCNKKVIETPGAYSYRCEKCQREFSEFKYQLMLNVNVMDATDNVWVTVFRDQAEVILGKSANEVGQLKDSESAESAFDELIQNASFTRWTFKLRVRMETYNDETRRKASCVTLQRIEPAEYHRHLINRIEHTAASL